MYKRGEIDKYFKDNFETDAINIFPIEGSNEVSKEKIASDILTNGIKLNHKKKISEVINPKGLVKDISSIESTIKKTSFYSENDICNVIIGTPQVVKLKDKEYYIGYPRDNQTGYKNATNQKNYDCFLTDYLENTSEISKEMIIGYYYQDEDGKNYFKKNDKYYKLLNKTDKETFFNNIISKMDNKITKDINKIELLKYIEATIEDKKTSHNSKYETSIEYLEYQNKKNTKAKKILTKNKFIEFLKDNYQDYALYLHGIDQEPSFSKKIVDNILKNNLFIDEYYGFCGTCEPKGPVDEISCLEDALDYHYGDNHKKSYNMIILTPKSIEDINNDTYFLGYSRNNTTNTFPKSMKDFDCLLSDIINDMDYVPKEFVLGYHIYGPNIDDRYILNDKHYSFLSTDLKKIIGTLIINRNNQMLNQNIRLFNKKNINEDLLYAYANPLIERQKISSLQTTSLEYFEEKNKSKNKVFELTI